MKKIEPGDLHVQVVKPYTKEYIPEDCCVIPMPDTRVADAIATDFKTWCHGQPVFIAAPTGAGKTSFLMEIWKFCRKVSPSKRILLLEHRIAIATQQKIDLLQKTKSKWSSIHDLSALEYVDDFDDVKLTIMTFQAFAARYRKMDLQQYSWVIFDESHFFYSDACFNSHLDQLLWNLPKLFAHAHRVYMTATPGAVLDDICAAERPNLQACYNCNSCPRDGIGKMLFYKFPNHFDRVHLFYFRKVEEIVELVLNHPDDKFLIFTSTREIPDCVAEKSYKKALESKHISVEYLDRFSKQSETWTSVCHDGKFTSQVLICTSVLDCGVSLHDAQLRHIIVESTDKTEFIQMLGRKRLYSAESVNVYVRALSSADINFRLKNVRSRLGLIQQGFQAAQAQKYDSLIYRGWTDESAERLYSHLLNYLGNGKVFPKLTAYHYLLWQQATLEQLLEDAEALGDDSALPRLAHNWLDNISVYDESHWLDYEQKVLAREQLLFLLKQYVDKPIDKNNWPSLSQKITVLINMIYKFPHDSGRNLGDLALNNRLRAIEIPYYFEKVGKQKYPVILREEVGSNDEG